MLMLGMPEKFWQIRLCKMPCNEKNGGRICDLTRYNPWIKRECICINPHKALFVRRSTTDKNGRVYSRHDSKWKCVIKILNNYNGEHQTGMYASSEIEYMKSLV